MCTLRMAREMSVPLVEIVHRMSVLPCEFMGLPSPVLQPGADASVVLFDWDRVAERNSYSEPLVHPDGIDAVWVHGELLHSEGRIHAPKNFHRPPPPHPPEATPLTSQLVDALAPSSSLSAVCRSERQLSGGSVSGGIRRSTQQTNIVRREARRVPWLVHMLLLDGLQLPGPVLPPRSTTLRD